MQSEDEIIIKYCSYLGRHMNYCLKSGYMGELAEQIIYLQKLLNNSCGIKKDTTLYRYVDELEMDSIENSKIMYISPIFLSTTFIYDVNGYNGKKNILELKVLKGTKGIFADDITGRNEQEFILPYNTKILVEEISSKSGIRKCTGVVI